MRKLTKKISMLMVLAMLVGLFSGVVSASAASAWSFKSGKYNVAVNGEINMKKNEYADFDLLKDGKAPEGYTVVWKSSDEDVVWVNAKTGQLRADKAKKAEDGDKAVISATFTNTKTKKSATRSFTIVVGEVKAPVYTVEQADVTAELGDAIKFAPVVKNEAGEVVKFATHKSYNGYFLDGKAITNPWTPEAAGEYTVVVAQFASKADVADLAKAVRNDEFKVTVKADLAAEATGLKEITVYGDFAADAKFTVKKDAKQNISFTATVAEDGKSAKLALQNKLFKGTYTVAYGDAKVDLAIEDEKVASIAIFEKDGQAFTSLDKEEAYVHYDVLNQYGESVRKSFDVTWNCSTAGGVTPDPTNGILTVVKAASGAVTDLTFNYNDTVVLTGVASGYGYAVSETATITIGLEDNASTVKVIGIIEEDTTKILDEVPASFVGGQYQLVFEMYNRAGYKMKFDEETAANDFTFTSLNPLLVKEVKGGWTVVNTTTKTNNIETVYIDGKAYGAVDIVAGNVDQVKAGGVAEIRIVSTKTGVSSNYSLRVVSEQVLVDFKIEQPSVVVPKDGEYGPTNEIELKFEATDSEGAPITDFRALYKAVSFSPAGSIELREQNDGSAKLFYMVTTEAPTKQNDYPVMLNAIVPGSGSTCNVRFSVKNDRIANSPLKYNDANELIEGGQLKLFLRDHDTWNRDGGIDWADQYDVSVKNNDKFRDRYVAIKVLGVEEDDNSLDFVNSTYDKDLNDDGDTNDAGEKNISNYVGTVDGYELYNVVGSEVVYLKAAADVTTDVKEYSVEFALYDHTKGEFVGGSDFVVSFKVVDLSQCVGFTVSVSDSYVMNGADISPNGDSVTADYSVKGTLSNGHQVKIPNTISGAVTGNAVITYTTTISGYKLWDGSQYTETLSGSASFNPNFDLTAGATSPVSASGNALLFKDQSKTNAEGDFADRALKIDVTAKIESENGATDLFKGEVKTSYEVANHYVGWTKINTKEPYNGRFTWTKQDTEAIIKPKDGKVTYGDLMIPISHLTDTYKDDIYGKNNANVTISITNLCEGNSGLNLVINGVDHTLLAGATVVGNSPNTVMILNAEIGDTFTATYTTNDGGAKHEIKYTIGADVNAKFDSVSDNLTWY